MSSQNSVVMIGEKIKDIMLDDKKKKTSDIRKHILAIRKRESYYPPKTYDSKVDIKKFEKNGNVYFSVQPKKSSENKFFFYIHGGGNCFQINKRQWEFVISTVIKTGYIAIVPIYPLAPEACAQDAFHMLMGTYRSVCKSGDIERFVLVGDSTGGGIALSMSILAWKKGLRRPDKLVLISPALDMEFMDAGMENSMNDRSKEYYQYYYRPAIKEFIRHYWVKDLVRQHEYVSPLYADLTDICDEMAIFTVEDDLLNCYARKLYEKMKLQQIKLHYFEFYGVIHDYIEHPLIPECKVILNKISESIKSEAKTVGSDIMHAVWARSLLAERYPKIYVDDGSMKLAAKLNTSYKDINAQYSEYDRLVVLGRIVEMDKRVRQFIKRYADGTIVNVGSELDTMFSRVDNGRISWYNVDLPERMELRRKLMESRDREVNIDKSILDFTWLDNVKKKPGHAILFVCCDVTKYFDEKRLKTFLDEIYQRFPGAEVVFDIKNSVGKRVWNFGVLTGKKKGMFVKVSIDNCRSLMYDWNIKYRVIYDQTILNSEDITEMFSEEVAGKYRHAIKRKYDKIIQLRLGTERAVDIL